MTTRISASVDLATTVVTASAENGKSLAIAGDPPEGNGSALNPKQALLAALVSCTAMDVLSILRKKRQRLDRYEVLVSGESAPDPPRVYTDIVVEHRVSGQVGKEPLRRSIELSATRYCPINAMLSAVARVEHRYLLLDDSGATHAATVAVVGPDREIRVLEPRA